MALIDDIKYRFSRLGFIGKLIVVNIVVFTVLNLLDFLFKSNVVTRFLYLPKEFGDFITQPWSLVSYSFLHGNLPHLAFNMISLYFIGRFFLSIHSLKRFLNVYLLGAIVGGCFFLLSYNLFPAFVGQNAPLVGASAAIMALLIFITTDRANMSVSILGYNITLWKIGVFFVLLDLIRIPMDNGSNAGGFISHLGGALLGYLYATQLSKGVDIGSGFEKMMDSIASYFKPREKSNLKTVYKNTKSTKKSTSSKNSYETKSDQQRQINEILEKISKSGYESLTQHEKDFLFRVGKEN